MNTTTVGNVCIILLILGVFSLIFLCVQQEYYTERYMAERGMTRFNGTWVKDVWIRGGHKDEK